MHLKTIDRLEWELGADKLPKTDAGGVDWPTKDKYFKIVVIKAKGKDGKMKERATMARTSIASRMSSVLRHECIFEGLQPDVLDPIIRHGLWALRVDVHSPRKRHKIAPSCKPKKLRTPEDSILLDVPIAFIDSDACLPPVKDCLEYAGILDDDVRITENTGRAILSAEPKLHIILERIT